MSVFNALGREHQLFESLLGRLEECLEEPDRENAVDEIKKLMLILLPALEKHEALEDELFPSGEDGEAEPKAGRLAARQHRALDAFRESLRRTLESTGRASFEEIRSAVLSFAEGLRRHFTTEERDLWPLYHRNMSRSLGNSTERRARRFVAAMERELKIREELIVGYLGAGRR